MISSRILLHIFIIEFIFILNIKNFVLSEFVNFDLNDILNEKLMPAALFAETQSFAKGTNITRQHFYQTTVQPAHSNINDAMNTMKYHRQKMNEYQASNFIAKHIVEDLSLKIHPKKMQRRLGTIMDDEFIDDDLDVGVGNQYQLPKINQNDDLLYDQGSSGYKDWLEKTTTFDDIQRQFGDNPYAPIPTNNNLRHKNVPNENINTPNPNPNENDNESEDDEYEEGDVTGYAYHRPVMNNQQQLAGPFPLDNYQMSPPLSGYESGTRNYGGGGVVPIQPIQMPKPNPTAGSKNEKFFSHAVHGVKHINYVPVPHIPNYHHHHSNNIPGNYHPIAQESFEHEEYGTPHHFPVQSTPSSSLKEIDLKDIMNIALTTLAFLSFGMFILQVLMCITMNNNFENQNGMMMMPMETPATPNDAAGGVDNVEEIRRKRRSIETNQIFKVNELSRRVLLSMDTVVQVTKDDGKCLRRILCDNNSFARKQKDGQKLWIPVWSLGISWLSSRFSSASSILSGLKATAIGLGGGNCIKNYPECDLALIIKL